MQRIPETLGEALEARGGRRGEVRLPGDMYRVFIHYKTDEWKRFIGTVSDWDVQSTWTCCHRKGAIPFTCAASQASSTATAHPTSGAR